MTSEWRDDEGERARRYYSITQTGQRSLAEFRTGWAQFSATVGGVLNHGHQEPVTGHRKAGQR